MFVSHCLSLTRETDDGRQSVKATSGCWLVLLATIFFFIVIIIPALHRDLDLFFFVYIQLSIFKQCYVCIYTRFYFFSLFFVSFNRQLLKWSHVTHLFKWWLISLIYTPMGMFCYFLLFFLFLFCFRDGENQSIAARLWCFFNPETSGRAHADLCSVRERHWENPLCWRLVAENGFPGFIVLPLSLFFSLSRQNRFSYFLWYVCVRAHKNRVHLPQCSPYNPLPSSACDLVPCRGRFFNLVWFSDRCLEWTKTNCDLWPRSLPVTWSMKDRRLCLVLSISQMSPPPHTHTLPLPPTQC